MLPRNAVGRVPESAAGGSATCAPAGMEDAGRAGAVPMLVRTVVVRCLAGGGACDGSETTDAPFVCATVAWSPDITVGLALGAGMLLEPPLDTHEIVK